MSMFIGRFLSISAGIFFISSVAAAQSSEGDSSGKAILIQRVLKVTRAGNQVIDGIKADIAVQRVRNSRVPAAFWGHFMVQANRRQGELLDSLALVYDRHFTVSELKALIGFYHSPLGRHLLKVQPLLARESMVIGQRWGARIGADVGQQLAAQQLLRKP